LLRPLLHRRVLSVAAALSRQPVLLLARRRALPIAALVAALQPGVNISFRRALSPPPRLTTISDAAPPSLPLTPATCSARRSNPRLRSTPTTHRYSRDHEEPRLRSTCCWSSCGNPRLRLTRRCTIEPSLHSLGSKRAATNLVAFHVPVKTLLLPQVSVHLLISADPVAAPGVEEDELLISLSRPSQVALLHHGTPAAARVAASQSAKDHQPRRPRCPEFADPASQQFAARPNRTRLRLLLRRVFAAPLPEFLRRPCPPPTVARRNSSGHPSRELSLPGDPQKLPSRG